MAHAPGTVGALLAKAQAVVDAIANEEANHGGLTSRETLVKAGELRLELSVWKGAGPTESPGRKSGANQPQSPGNPDVATSDSAGPKFERSR